VASATCEVSSDRVTDSSSATVQVADPSIHISKTLSCGDSPVCAGSTVTFSVSVTAGCAALSDIAITDRRVPNCTRTLDHLNAGQCFTYSCGLATVTASFTNKIKAVAVVSASQPPSTVSDSSTLDVTVEAAQLTIKKTATPPRIPIGDAATFRVTLSNLGSSACTNVQVVDALVPNCTRSFTTLLSGAQNAISYKCVRPAPVFTSFENTASVTATCGTCDASAADSATVTVKCCDHCSHGSSTSSSSSSRSRSRASGSGGSSTSASSSSGRRSRRPRARPLRSVASISGISGKFSGKSRD